MLSENMGQTGVFQQSWTQWGQMVGAVWSDAEPNTGHAQRHAYEVKCRMPGTLLRRGCRPHFRSATNFITTSA